MSTYIVVVDDEPDVESMFRQHFRRDLRSGRFVMEFALSAQSALEQVKARRFQADELSHSLILRRLHSDEPCATPQLAKHQA